MRLSAHWQARLYAVCASCSRDSQVSYIQYKHTTFLSLSFIVCLCGIETAALSLAQRWTWDGLTHGLGWAGPSYENWRFYSHVIETLKEVTYRFCQNVIRNLA